MTATTMTARNHDDQLGEIYLTMLNELCCTFGVSFFSHFHHCESVTVMVIVCGRCGLWPSRYRPCRPSVCLPCVPPETLSTRYPEKYVTDIHQTHMNDALWRCTD